MTITIAIGAMICAALFLASFGVYWATQASDTVSVERQARSAQHAMETSVDELALQQETVAVWDDAVAHVIAEPRDMSWIHDNIGGWLNRIFGHDEVFILDGYGRPVYASVDGLQVPLERYAALAPDFQFLLGGVRGEISGGRNGRHDRNSSRAVAHFSTVRTTSRATHESHLTLIGGRPAAASVMRIEPSTANYVQARGEWPVLIGVRYLDRDFLVELSTRQLISAPRFSRNAARHSGEHVIRLATEWGSAIGFLIWRPELPGTRILWRLVPLNLLILSVLASFMVFLGRRLRRAAGELASAEARAAHLAYHDSLTGLPNRALFQSRLEELTDGERAGRGLALLLLDVDEFKLTNDTLGHDAGDAVLREFAARLLLAIRPEDSVARLGGDEFALLLVGRTDPAELEVFSARLLERLAQPIECHGKEIHCGASIGAGCSAGAESASSLLKHADLALYEAKASGRGAFRLYNPTMWSSVVLRREMLAVAAAALKGDFITPFYQPKVDLQTGAILGFEALLRCCIPGQQAQGPECVSAAFEDLTLAVKLSDRMVDGVIRDISTWRAAGLPFGHVAINAALAELRRGDFAERLIAKLNTAEIPPECIQVEVTESVLLGQGIDQIEDTFGKLASHGIRLALDDFGTGFASLTHLKRFPIAIIKIDRSFVRDLQIDAEDGAIVDALIGLGRALRIEVVAEGIETEAQHYFLAQLGCTVGQGFLFGDAQPAERIAELLRKVQSKMKRAAA